MDAMALAIKKKRMGQKPGLMTEGKEVEPIEHEANEMHVGMDMTPLLQSLSPEQKKALYQALEQDLEGEGAEETLASDVAKGKPTKDEKMAIASKMAEEGDEPTEETDMAMLQGSKKAVSGKPRNLGERAMVAAQERMKQRGKG